MSLEIKGKVVAKLPTQSGTSKSGNAWKKAEIVVEIPDEKYPKKVCLQGMNKSAEILEGCAVGQSGTFFIDVESREYNGRWYTQVGCYKFTPDAVQQMAPPQQQQYAQPAPQVANQPQQQDNGVNYNDLPF